jgi:hypothetical protein
MEHISFWFTQMIPYCVDAYILQGIKKNTTEDLLVASKDIGLEVNI